MTRKIARQGTIRRDSASLLLYDQVIQAITGCVRPCYNRSTMSAKTIGIVTAIAGASLWGFSGACMQYLYAHYEIEPLFITGVRTLGAGVLFLALLLGTKREQLAGMLSERDSLVQLVVFGSFGLFLCQAAYVVSVGFTNAGTATVLQALNMVIVLAVTCVQLRRRPGGLELLSVGLAFAAVLLIATKGDLGTLNIPVEGLIWGHASAVTAAFYIMYPKRLFEKWGSLPVTGIGMLIGGITAWLLITLCALLDALSGGLVGMPFTVPALDANGIAVLAAIAVFGTFGAFGLYLHGVSIAGSVAGSLLGAMEPVSATLFSALWLGTFFTWADWLGLVLMVVTIAIISTRKRT